MKRVFMGSICFLSMFLCNGQINSIKGNVQDTSEKKILKNASVSLLWAKDTTLIRFTRTTADGSFQFKSSPTGDLLLLVTFPEYADSYQRITLQSNSDLQLKTLPMILRSQLLEEVVV